jgi:hypothetical protein
MKKTLRKKLINALSIFICEPNNREIRSKIKNTIEEIMGYSFIDATTAEDIDNGYIFFYGYNKITKKILDITICPNE